MEIIVGAIWGVASGYGIAIVLLCFIDKRGEKIPFLSYKDMLKFVKED